MSLKECIYSVLVVSAAEKLNNALSPLLPESHYSPVRFVSNVSSARRIWSEQEFDYLIVNSPLPDHTGIQFAIDAAGSKGSVVLLLVRAELYEDVFEQIAPHGVFALSKPISRPVLTAALDWHDAQTVAALAVRALLYEVAVTPKPGLVDRENNGSHHGF